MHERSMNLWRRGQTPEKTNDCHPWSSRNRHNLSVKIQTKNTLVALSLCANPSAATQGKKTACAHFSYLSFPFSSHIHPHQIKIHTNMHNATQQSIHSNQRGLHSLLVYFPLFVACLLRASSHKSLRFLVCRWPFALDRFPSTTRVGYHNFNQSINH